MSLLFVHLSKRMCQPGDCGPPCLGPSSGYTGMQNFLPKPALLDLVWPLLKFHSKESRAPTPTICTLYTTVVAITWLSVVSEQNFQCVWNVPITKYTHCDYNLKDQIIVRLNFRLSGLEQDAIYFLACVCPSSN